MSWQSLALFRGWYFKIHRTVLPKSPFGVWFDTIRTVLELVGIKKGLNVFNSSSSNLGLLCSQPVICLAGTTWATWYENTLSTYCYSNHIAWGNLVVDIRVDNREDLLQGRDKHWRWHLVILEQPKGHKERMSNGQDKLLCPVGTEIIRNMRYLLFGGLHWNWHYLNLDWR